MPKKGAKSSSRNSSRSSPKSSSRSSPKSSSRISSRNHDVNDNLNNILEKENFMIESQKAEIDKIIKFGTIVLVFEFILIMISITINFMALQWILKLEQISCKCSENWKRDYIKYVLYGWFLYILVPIIFNLYELFTGETLSSSSIFDIIKLIFGLFFIANVIISIMYISELKETKCSCSEDIRRETYYYYQIISSFLFALTFLGGILLVIFSISLLKKI